MIDLRRLAVFREVVRRGSFSAAAEALHYSQPAVSHHMARLEAEVGAQLILRDARAGLSLTEAGRVLLAHADELLACAQTAEADLAALVSRRQHSLRLGAFAVASATIIASAAERFRRVRPDVTLTLIEGDAAETVERLRQRTIDIGILLESSLHPVLHGDSELEPWYVINDPFRVALPRGHRLSFSDSVPLASLRDEDWIEGAQSDLPSSRTLSAAFIAAGYQPRVAFSVGDYDVVQRLVGAGFGVALVPQLATVNSDVDGVRYVPVSPALARQVVVAVSSLARRSEAAESMLQWLKDACGELLAEGPPVEARA